MGHHNRHFAGDRFANAGRWSPPTSKANFCEEDYAVTLYIAEFINALSSLVYVHVALRVAGPSWPSLSSRLRDPLLMALSFVGIASAAFHATLRQQLQFADDLSMLVLGAALLREVFARDRPVLSATLCAAVAAVSAIYVRSGAILIHFTSFVTIVVLLVTRTWYLVRYTGKWTPDQRARLIRRFRFAGAYLLVAFGLWNVDLELCAPLRDLRARIGLPWGWLLEMHGWWHILTALGAAEYIVLVRTLEQ